MPSQKRVEILAPGDPAAGVISSNARRRLSSGGGGSDSGSDEEEAPQAVLGRLASLGRPGARSAPGTRHNGGVHAKLPGTTAPPLDAAAGQSDHPAETVRGRARSAGVAGGFVASWLL
jgi:hypothetical protein